MKWGEKSISGFRTKKQRKKQKKTKLFGNQSGYSQHHRIQWRNKRNKKCFWWGIFTTRDTYVSISFFFILNESVASAIQMICFCFPGGKLLIKDSHRKLVHIVLLYPFLFCTQTFFTCKITTKLNTHAHWLILFLLLMLLILLILNGQTCPCCLQSAYFMQPHPIYSII